MAIRYAGSRKVGSRGVPPLMSDSNPRERQIIEGKAALIVVGIPPQYFHRER